MDPTLDNWHPYPILPILFLAIYNMVLQAQLVPTPALFSTIWLTLINHLLPHPIPCRATNQLYNIVNARPGHALRTHCTLTMEHFIHGCVGLAGPQRPRAAGVRIIILQTSQFPNIPSVATDVVAQTAIYIIFIQLGLSILLNKLGFASTTIVVVSIAETLIGLLAWEVLRHVRHHNLKAMPVIPPNQREVLCMSIGPATTDVVIIISGAGAAQLEYLAESHVPPRWGRLHFIAAPVFILTLCALSAGFSRLSATDAWCLLTIWTPGIAHAAYAAQTWRTPSALGFKFTKEAVRGCTGAQVVEEVERIEPMAGPALRRMLAMDERRPIEDV